MRMDRGRLNESEKRMRWHFWSLWVASLLYLGYCIHLVVRFPTIPYDERFDPDSIQLHADQLFLWAVLVCSTGMYATFVGALLAHAFAARVPFWRTAILSALFYVGFGESLLALVIADGPPPGRRGLAQINGVLFVDTIYGLSYLVAMAIVHSGLNPWDVPRTVRRHAPAEPTPEPEAWKDPGLEIGSSKR